ncbi:MAG: ATP synthase F1 subunit delta [Muribaculaceae bacterium]|nr:ATP synthase F1 subunit delta [Muribaculaceae bacterium]
MSDGLIPRRYAKALYKLAVENGDSEEIYELLKKLSFRHTAIDELKRAVLNPGISDEDKGAYMLQLAGGKPGSSLDKFLLLCVRNNRSEYLQKISLAYVDLYREAHEIAHVVVTTAVPMPEAQMNAIIDIVKKRLGAKSLEIEEKIDPEIIGGFIVTINGLVLDASVRRELNELQLQLLKK